METSNVSFEQTKLSKNEWEYIEIPIQGKEKTIIEAIKNSFETPDVKTHKFDSILRHLKTESVFPDYLIEKYLKKYILQILKLLKVYYELYNDDADDNDNNDPMKQNYQNLTIAIKNIFNNYDIDFDTPSLVLKKTYLKKMKMKMKTKDQIRITNTFNKNGATNFINNDDIYDFVCLKQLINILLCVFNDTINVSLDDLYLTPSATSKKIERLSKKEGDNKTTKQCRTLESFNSVIIDKVYSLIKIADYGNCSKTATKSASSITIFTDFVREVSLFIASNIDVAYSMKNIGAWIENNDMLNKYSVMELYEHQKHIFNIFNGKPLSGIDKDEHKNKFVYYCAPTGTGKTLTPLAIANKYKVIFVCAARHIGLTFARNAITCGYKVALAFNCSDTEDIRLHYSAAKVFTKNYKSGGIYKVDNTVGDKVDIIISDLKSYTYASLYMKAFNDVKNVVAFWDEPTISMDYQDHKLHGLIHDNWKNNIIPNMVLSSATLPQYENIRSITDDFKEKFNASVHYIKTYDFKKSICIYDNDTDISTPHHFLKKRNASFDYVKTVLHSIKNDKTLMRYLHIESCVDFINQYGSGDILELYDGAWYELSSSIIKELYLKVFDTIDEETWNTIVDVNNQPQGSPLFRKYYDRTDRFLAEDAYTLTNGPSIFLVDDVFSIAKACFKQLNIDTKQLDRINDSIVFNNGILGKIKVIEKQQEDEERKINPSNDKDNKMERAMSDESVSKVRRLQDKIDSLYRTMKKTHVPNHYIPNSYEHLTKYKARVEKSTIEYPKNERRKPFTSTLTEQDISKVVAIPNVDDSWRLLLMCGVGIVSDSMSNEYNILINDFASDQKLFMLIASSDYIYGTNYSFHHGYIGADMVNNSRQKLIQAFGRIGRGSVNQHYSIRMLDDDIINVLFNDTMNNEIEAYNMNALFKFYDEGEEDGDEDSNDNEAGFENNEEMLDYLIEEGWVCNDESVNDDEEEDGGEDSNDNEINEESDINKVIEIECDDWEELCFE